MATLTPLRYLCLHIFFLAAVSRTILCQSWGLSQTGIFNSMRQRLQSLIQDQTPYSFDVVRQLIQVQPQLQDSSTWIATSKTGNLGSSFSFKKPPKYHHYPHDQHQLWLPECATQQVCSAVYTRLNITQPLCACSDRFESPCSTSLRKNDVHTVEVGLHKNLQAPTLIKTCERTSDIRTCRSPQDWALLALQNVRTGKSQYLIICRCEQGVLEGPVNHDQPSYARVPGIRVYGMMCIAPDATEDRRRQVRSPGPELPWEKVSEFVKAANWD